MWKPIIVLAELALIFFTLSEANHCQCPKNEIYEQCLSCPDRNCGVNIAAVACAPTPIPGDPDCNPGCRCRDGYLRNRNGTCIPENQCPNHRKCPKNEIYEQCLSCPARNCGVNIAAVSCLPSPNPGDPDCNPGCRCRDGYLRNGNGICIPENQCPTCPQNEVYDVCPAPCPPQRCGVDETLILCAPSPSPGDANCEPGCRCEYGLVRNDEGVCVNKDECPPTCGKNEIYSNCSNGGCGPFYCSDLGFPTGCVKMDQKYCKPGCICKEGYVRDDNDICIRNSRCPSCGGDPNAVSGCGTNCGRLCSNYDKGNISCTAICNRNACDCRKGYVYDENTEKCVLPDNCSSNKCKKPHQVYDPCLQVCPPGTCQSIGKHYHCPRSRTGDECKGGCRCKKGYYKNSIGECITEENCLKCNGPNEYWSCGGACDNVCSTLSQQNQTNCPIVNVKCNPMCYCEKGYARNASNICVPIKECPENQCGVNERYEECPAALCPPQSCSELGFSKTCPNATDPCPGPPGCVCINGYVRNKRGKCIPKQNCPSCGGDSNAVAGCGVCQKRCSDTGPRPCPRICLINACNCKEGFVLDDDTGKCIPPEQCPLKCPENEVYSACTQGRCTAKNCTQLGQPVPCIKIDPKYCIKGCICKEGWLRNENGECVPEDQCNQCNKPNEYYDSCAPTCPPQTCESIGKVYDCPITAQVCRGACRCKKGYFRNKIGDCISQENCLKCTGPNEYWSCGSACDNVCATLNQQNQTNCPVINVKCNPKCYCESGFARNVNNTCIPIDQCPPPTCPANERLEECPGAMCTPKSCSQLGFPIPCELTLADGSNSCPGPAECVCDNDLVRDDDGNCVPKQECPSCGGDPYAVAGCGVNCGKRCSTYKIKYPICPLICELNGCDCKKGYVYDDNLKKCVHPKNCST